MSYDGSMDAWKGLEDEVVQAAYEHPFVHLSDGDDISIIVDTGFRPELLAIHWSDEGKVRCKKTKCPWCEEGTRRSVERIFLVYEKILGRLVPRVLQWPDPRGLNVQRKVMETGGKVEMILSRRSRRDRVYYGVQAGDPIKRDDILAIREHEVGGLHPYHPDASSSKVWEG